MSTLDKLQQARKLLSEVFQEHYYDQDKELLWFSNLLITMGGLSGVIQCYQESPYKKKGEYVGEKQKQNFK
jgi:hypothetical protein